MTDSESWEIPDANTMYVNTIYVECYAGRSQDGLVEQFTRNATMTRTATGRWEIRFNDPHPDGDQYIVTLTSEEEQTLRDGVHVHISQGTQNANGFDVWLGTGDNGAAADAYRNNPFEWSVTKGIDVLIPEPVVSLRFYIPPTAQVSNTKFNLDDPTFTNAYGVVGSNNWTVAQLAAALNASAANATPPTVPSGIDYSTTVWAEDTSTNSVYVVSGPVPTSLDLVSVPISIPIS